MGLRDKARKYKRKSGEKTRFPVEFNLYNFITELLNDNKLEMQIQTILFSFMSTFNVNKILINFLDKENNIYRLLGYKGINEENRSDFDIDFHDYFLKSFKEPVLVSKLIKEPKYKDELNNYLTYDFKIFFPLLYKKELIGFITLGEKMDKREYVDEDIAYINQLSRIIASSLFITYTSQDNQQKFDELDKDYKMYLTLFESIENINLAEDFDEAVTIFYRTIKDFYDVKIATIMIKDNIAKGYKAYKSLGLTKETDDNFKIKEESPAFSNIIELGESMYIPDFQELDVYKNGISDKDKEKIRTFYCVPIKLGSKGLGFFNVFDTGDDDTGELSSIKQKILSYLPHGLIPYIIDENI